MATRISVKQNYRPAAPLASICYSLCLGTGRRKRRGIPNSQTGSAAGLNLLFAMPGDRATEKAWHSKFSDRQRRWPLFVIRYAWGQGDGKGVAFQILS